METRLESQGRNQADPPSPARVAQRDGAIGRVAQQGQRHAGQPAAHHGHHLPRVDAERLVSPLPSGIELGRGRQAAQEGQGPAVPAPGDIDDQRQNHPAQAARDDELTLAGGNRVAMVGAFADRGPAPPLQGLIDDQGQCALGSEGLDQQEEQAACEFQGGPAGAAEDGMEPAEVGVVLVSGGAEGRGDGASSAGQDRARDEDLGLLPRGSGKDRTEVGQDG